MRIADLLLPQSIELEATPQDKLSAIKELVDLMDKSGNINDKEKYLEAVLAREQEGSTGIGEGIAIPHAKTEAVDKAGLAAMVVSSGVDFDSLDGDVAKLFFLIAAPSKGENIHLNVLSR